MKGSVVTPSIRKFFRPMSVEEDGVSDSEAEPMMTITPEPESEQGLSGASTSSSASDTVSHKSDQSVGLVNDLGFIIKPSMTVNEVCQAVSKLTNGQKYQLLTDHYKPNIGFTFPKAFSNGCNRSFQYRWQEKYPWLVYSKAVNGGFCKFCALFTKNRTKFGVLVNKPFTSLIGSRCTKLWMAMLLIATTFMLLKMSWIFNAQ